MIKIDPKKLKIQLILLYEDLTIKAETTGTKIDDLAIHNTTGLDYMYDESYAELLKTINK